MGSIGQREARIGSGVAGARAERLGLAGFAVAALLLLAAAPANAVQTHLIVEDLGSAAQPSFDRAGSLAIDRSSGDLLVIDTQARTLSRFKPNGEPDPFPALGTNVIDAKKGPGGKACAEEPSSCDQTSQNGFVFSSWSNESQVAVDNSGGPTDGNIYVTQAYQSVGNLIDIFAPSGEYVGQLTAAGGTRFGPFGPCGVAVDVAGNLFASNATTGQIFKFTQPAVPHNPLEDSDGAPFSAVALERPCGLAVGAGPTAGAIFVAEQAHESDVYKLDAASGGLEYAIGEQNSGATTSLAVNPDNGHLYLVKRLPTGTSLELREYDVSGASAELLSGSPGGFGIAAEGAGAEERIYNSVGGTVKIYGPRVTLPEPETGEATEIEELSVTVNGTVDPDGDALTECHFEYGAGSFEHSEPCVESVSEIGAGRDPVPVHAKLEGLALETEYRFRLVTANANAALYPEDPRATPKGETHSFETPARPRVPAAWSTSVTTDSAVIKAQVDPESLPTTYRFEWGLAEGPYANSTGEIPIGSDSTEHTVGLLLDGLAPGTEYRYRAVATNKLGSAEAERTFRTFRVGGTEKGACANEALRSGAAAAALPDCRAYELVSPLEKGNGDIISPLEISGASTAFYQAAEEGGGLAYSSYRAFPDAEGAPYTSQYIATRGAGGWSTRAISPPQGVTRGEPATYDNQFLGATPDLGYGWFYRNSDPQLTADAPEGFHNVYRRTIADGTFAAINTVPPNPSRDTEPWPQGFSADGAHAVFSAEDKLTPDARVNRIFQLYLWSEGEGLRLASVLPDGTASRKDSVVGGGRGGTSSAMAALRDGSYTHALSDDGSRLYFASEEVLYLRTNPAEEQSAISAGECTEAAKACTVEVGEGDFVTAAVDGSRALFSSAGTLYEYDAESETTSEIAGSLKGVLGAGEDGRRVYFASDAVLAEGATAGQNNVYLREAGGATTFVATLADADTNNYSKAAFGRTSRVSPDGLHLVFLSKASPTGYDNTDAVRGEADAEVYLYDAASGRLECASCNPSGARPRAVHLNPHRYGADRFAAAYIPGWRTALYASNALSDDGSRLFFTAADALSPRDTNGRLDVYEWEQAGKGSCREKSSVFSPANGGCIYLISSGQSAGDSEFLDASPDGEEVFFTTESGLLPQDFGLVDIYAAKTGGGFPVPPAAAASCEGEACQSPPGAPEDPSPASEAFRGAGNLAQSAAAPRGRCGATARRAKRLARQAKHRRGVARRSTSPQRRRRLRRAARGKARSAAKLSRAAKRCRARARTAGRAGR